VSGLPDSVATLTAISMGLGDIPSSSAAATAIGMTMMAVAMLLMSWPRMAVRRKKPASRA